MSDCNKPADEYELDYIVQTAQHMCVLDDLRRWRPDCWDEYRDRTVMYAHGTDADRERIAKETHANVTDRRTADEYLANLDTLRYAAVAVRPERWTILTGHARRLARHLLKLDRGGRLTPKRLEREVNRFLDRLSR